MFVLICCLFGMYVDSVALPEGEKVSIAKHSLGTARMFARIYRKAKK